MATEKRRILCAESNKDVGELLAFMLDRQGYHVEFVQTVADCLKLASTERFDLYLLNDTYIDGDSLELCRELRAIDPDTPVLLFSLDSSGFDSRRVAEEGVKVFKSNTSDFVTLIQTVNNLLQFR